MRRQQLSRKNVKHSRENLAADMRANPFFLVKYFFHPPHPVSFSPKTGNVLNIKNPRKEELIKILGIKIDDIDNQRIIGKDITSGKYVSIKNFS